MVNKTCCFIGHREINETEELYRQLYMIIEDLILNYKVNTFLFGSKSRFNSLCYELVTEMKEKHPGIRRIYVRAEFPQINESYRDYLLEKYEDTYYPNKALNAGRAVYVERNSEMIDQSFFCIIYYKDGCSPQKRKSGTKIAFDYAIKMKRKIILLPSDRT